MLTRPEIYLVVNGYIGVENGYLGNFSYRTLEEFYPMYCDLDISPSTYQGTTRERFIQILQESDALVQAKILEGILNKYPVEDFTEEKEKKRRMAAQIKGIIARLKVKQEVINEVLEEPSITIYKSLPEIEEILESKIEDVHLIRRKKAKALIIGNAEYKGNILDNPINDANDINEVLVRLGFETTLLTNVNTVQQDKEITDFGTTLDEHDVALFYFAGHGFQLNNENFLAATDTNFDDEEHAKHSAFPLNILLSYLNKSKNRTNILILDACRDLLNKKAWYRSVKETGLAPIFAPKGTIIAYATSPGETALDGSGKRNGAYTRALLQHITVENIPIEEMFKRVRNTVFAFTKGRQTSWEHTSLTGTFYFNVGQLAHSIEIEYSSDVIQDYLYQANTKTDIDSIIFDLKSHDWYKQNPAINKIASLVPEKEDKNKLFLLGRNILQAACGSSGNAMKFMDNLQGKIEKFSLGEKNHVLNGLIYETFFNSYSNFRQDEIKTDYIEVIYRTLTNSSFNKSLDFLNQILFPYKDILFYIPSINKIGVSLDLDFEVQQNEIPRLKSIKHEGDDVLVHKEESDPFWKIFDEVILNKN